MEIQELKQELLDKKVRPYYIFTGDEIALQDVYVNKIAEISGLEKVSADNVREIYSTLTAHSLIKVAPKLYVIRNDMEYYNGSSWDGLYKAKNLKGNILVLKYSGVEKSSKFCKAHEKILTRFDYLKGTYLKNRINATTGMPLPYCDDIVKMCSYNYGRIKNELCKLQNYALANNFNWNIAYLESKKINLIHADIGDIIFDYTDAMAARQIALAYHLYEQLKTTDEGTIKLLSVLYTTFRGILMVQSTPLKERTEAILGITQAQIYRLNQKCGKYNLVELVNIVKTIRYLEKGIKTGQVEDRFAIPYLMGTMW